MRILISGEQIEHRIRELAAQINADYEPIATAARPLVCIAVLKGAVVFASALLQRLTVPVELDFMQVSSYGAAGQTRGELALRKDLELPIEDRDVLLIEDIVDSGSTVALLLELLELRGVRSLRLCTLLDKPAARHVTVPIAYRGFAIENNFVVGYGLDHAERYRNLPDIAVWEPQPAAQPQQDSAAESARKE
jgi:hypoxanthine phosphoribosyltransferase